MLSRTGVSEEDCAALCNEDELCGAFEHHSDRKQCSLLEVNEEAKFRGMSV